MKNQWSMKSVSVQERSNIMHQPSSDIMHCIVLVPLPLGDHVLRSYKSTIKRTKKMNQ